MSASGCSCESEPQGFGPLHPECLGHLWVFRGLSPGDAQALVESAVRRRRLAGSLLFSQGEPVEEMFLLKAGRVKLTRLQANGAETTLGIRGPGAVIGETVLTEEGVYPLSAWCMEDCLTCGFTRSAFEALVLRHPGIGLQVIRNMSDRIAQLTDQLENVTVGSLEDRLLRVLTQLAREHGRPEGEDLLVPFNLTHEELGLLVGAHRVSVTRALGSLRARQAISIGKDGLVVLSH